MVAEKISPHEIVRVFTEGRKLPSLRSRELTYIFDAISNICMVADEAGHDIIMVGRHSAMTKYNNSRPDYERDLTPISLSLVLTTYCELGIDNENKKRHLRRPGHDWDLVCDGSDEAIAAIIREVMETGGDSISWKGDLVKYKWIKGYLVVVIYKIEKGRRVVGTAFVCKPGNEGKYLPKDHK
jgi:hypothetical protein